MKKPRVILADDHTFVLEGFKKLLDVHCELVASVEDGRALLEAAVSLKPDVVILDISMPKLNGIEAAKKLKKQVPAVKLIFRDDACRHGLCRCSVQSRSVRLFAETISSHRVNAGGAVRDE